jgi:GLPGLI family protein
MMRKFTLLFILLFGLIINQSHAQFTGKVQVNSYDVNAGHKQKNNDESAVLYITPTRIMIQTNQDVKFGGGMKTQGLLVRNDKDDILIFTGKDEAMKMTKSGIVAFMKMAAGFSSNSNDNKSDKPEFSFKKTGKTKKIDGYKCDQFTYTNKDEPNQHTEVWMTKSLDINWGFLTDLAAQAEESFGKTGKIAANMALKKGYFPLLGKQYKNNKLTNVFKLKITPTSSAKSHVNVPSDIQVMSLQQYMMQKMQQSKGNH